MSSFYVGGRYVSPNNDMMAGQMYVEVYRPPQVTPKYPLVFIHGLLKRHELDGHSTRAGWVDYFVKQGYVVCLVDQSARGRSPWHGEVNGAVHTMSASEIERRFTAPKVFSLWPQAKSHTQWPGDSDKKGRRGDPIFDAFMATQVQGIDDIVETETLIQAAGTRLLDKMGPSILVTHSQSGSFEWLLADKRPSEVKGIVAIEPAGPPFRNSVFNQDPARAWGITDIPIS